MRRLVATLACRLAGTRLYGKPLQNLDIEREVSILEHQIQMLGRIAAIDEIVLGIASGRSNEPLVEFAEKRGVRYILGDEIDVLARLIACVEAGDGTDAFRITTESPFTHWESIDEGWGMHLEAGNDVTVLDGVALGSGYEIYTREALRESHRLGDERHRSELCSLYIRENRDDFSVGLVHVDEASRRPDLRLTVDYPEDLVVCRAVYERFRDRAPLIPSSEIAAFLDGRPDLTALIAELPAGGYWGQ